MTIKTVAIIGAGPTGGAIAHKVAARDRVAIGGERALAAGEGGDQHHE